jgi:hypothetical protein
VNGWVLRVPDCIRDGIRAVVPQRAEWQHIGNQIDAAMMLRRAAQPFNCFRRLEIVESKLGAQRIL